MDQVLSQAMSQTTSTCQCESLGWCNRYHKEMTERTYQICRGEVLTPDICDAYRNIWRDEAKSPENQYPLDCTNRGSQTGTVTCVTCGDRGNVVPVYECSVYGKCVQRPYQVIKSEEHVCVGCERYRQPDVVEVVRDRIHYRGPVVRNLAYYLGPYSGNGVWQRNIDQLAKRIGVFNGKRVFAISISPDMDDPRMVREYLAKCNPTSVIEIPNSSTLREVVAFHPLLSQVASTDPSEITFFAHAKGVTRPVNDGVTVHRWTDIMYETNLDYPPLVEDLLQSYPIAGSFKKVGRGFEGSLSSFHYSGTFYWLRNSEVFTKNWRTIDMQWWGTESWPGLHFKPSEAGCIFHSGTVPSLDLYSMEYLTTIVEPQYEEWKLANASRAIL